MPIVQENICIPVDIAEGIAKGVYQRKGNIVRYAAGPNKGRIVKHLETIDFPVLDQTPGLGAKAMQIVQCYKKRVGIALVGVAVVSFGIYGYHKWRNHEPDVLAEFRASLETYIDDIRNGNMDIDKINNLLKSLDDLKNCKDYGKISIQLSVEDIEVLVKHNYDFTIKLASDNAVELSNGELDLNGNAVYNLQSYLKTQKRILETQKRKIEAAS